MKREKEEEKARDRETDTLWGNVISFWSSTTQVEVIEPSDILLIYDKKKSALQLELSSAGLAGGRNWLKGYSYQLPSQRKHGRRLDVVSLLTTSLSSPYLNPI